MTVHSRYRRVIFLCGLLLVSNHTFASEKVAFSVALGQANQDGIIELPAGSYSGGMSQFLEASLGIENQKGGGVEFGFFTIGKTNSQTGDGVSSLAPRAWLSAEPQHDASASSSGIAFRLTKRTPIQRGAATKVHIGALMWNTSLDGYHWNSADQFSGRGPYALSGQSGLGLDLGLRLYISNRQDLGMQLKGGLILTGNGSVPNFSVGVTFGG